MSALRVVEGDARDVAAIMPIMDSAFDPAFGEAWTAAQCISLLAAPGTALHIALIGEEVAGFALCRWVLEEQELLMIGVAPRFQRIGVASNLLAHIIEHARSLNQTRIFLEVRSNNSALNFYSKLGFEYCGTRKYYYRGANGDRYDATTMTLNL